MHNNNNNIQGCITSSNHTNIRRPKGYFIDENENNNNNHHHHKNVIKSSVNNQDNDSIPSLLSSSSTFMILSSSEKSISSSNLKKNSKKSIIIIEDSDNSKIVKKYLYEQCDKQWIRDYLDKYSNIKQYIQHKLNHFKYLKLKEIKDNENMNYNQNEKKSIMDDDHSQNDNASIFNADDTNNDNDSDDNSNSNEAFEKSSNLMPNCILFATISAIIAKNYKEVDVKNKENDQDIESIDWYMNMLIKQINHLEKICTDACVLKSMITRWIEHEKFMFFKESIAKYYTLYSIRSQIYEKLLQALNQHLPINIIINNNNNKYYLLEILDIIHHLRPLLIPHFPLESSLAIIRASKLSVFILKCILKQNPWWINDLNNNNNINSYYSYYDNSNRISHDLNLKPTKGNSRINIFTISKFLSYYNQIISTHKMIIFDFTLSSTTTISNDFLKFNTLISLIKQKHNEWLNLNIQPIIISDQNPNKSYSTSFNTSSSYWQNLFQKSIEINISKLLIDSGRNIKNPLIQNSIHYIPDISITGLHNLLEELFMKTIIKKNELIGIFPKDLGEMYKLLGFIKKKGQPVEVNKQKPNQYNKRNYHNQKYNLKDNVEFYFFFNKTSPSDRFLNKFPESFNKIIIIVFDPSIEFIQFPSEIAIIIDYGFIFNKENYIINNQFSYKIHQTIDITCKVAQMRASMATKRCYRVYTEDHFMKLRESNESSSINLDKLKLLMLQYYMITSKSLVETDFVYPLQNMNLKDLGAIWTILKNLLSLEKNSLPNAIQSTATTANNKKCLELIKLTDLGLTFDQSLALSECNPSISQSLRLIFLFISITKRRLMLDSRMSIHPNSNNHNDDETRIIIKDISCENKNQQMLDYRIDIFTKLINFLNIMASSSSSDTISNKCYEEFRLNDTLYESLKLMAANLNIDLTNPTIINNLKLDLTRNREDIIFKLIKIYIPNIAIYSLSNDIGFMHGLSKRILYLNPLHLYTKELSSIITFDYYSPHSLNEHNNIENPLAAVSKYLVPIYLAKLPSECFLMLPTILKKQINIREIQTISTQKIEISSRNLPIIQYNHILSNLKDFSSKLGINDIKFDDTTHTIKIYVLKVHEAKYTLILNRILDEYMNKIRDPHSKNEDINNKIDIKSNSSIDYEAKNGIKVSIGNGSRITTIHYIQKIYIYGLNYSHKLIIENELLSRKLFKDNTEFILDIISNPIDNHENLNIDSNIGILYAKTKRISLEELNFTLQNIPSLPNNQNTSPLCPKILNFTNDDDDNLPILGQIKSDNIVGNMFKSDILKLQIIINVFNNNKTSGESSSLESNFMEFNIFSILKEKFPSTEVLFIKRDCDKFYIIILRILNNNKIDHYNKVNKLRFQNIEITIRYTRLNSLSIRIDKNLYSLYSDKFKKIIRRCIKMYLDLYQEEAHNALYLHTGKICPYIVVHLISKQIKHLKEQLQVLNDICSCRGHLVKVINLPGGLTFDHDFLAAIKQEQLKKLQKLTMTKYNDDDDEDDKSCNNDNKDYNTMDLLENILKIESSPQGYLKIEEKQIIIYTMNIRTLEIVEKNLKSLLGNYTTQAVMFNNLSNINFCRLILNSRDILPKYETLLKFDLIFYQKKIIITGLISQVQNAINDLNQPRKIEYTNMLCEICKSNMILYTKLELCGHLFCDLCLVKYIIDCINKNKLPLICTECSSLISIHDLVEILDEETIKVLYESSIKMRIVPL